jgi:hypothetical protein
MGSTWDHLGSTWRQPEVNLGSTWGQPGVNLGSTWGHLAAAYLVAVKQAVDAAVVLRAQPRHVRVQSVSPQLVTI